MASRSSSPRPTLSISAAHSTSSSRESGNSRPLGVPATACPDRPTRCRNAEIERGEPSWQTRSTSPMSMPSSSEAVATSALSLPCLSRCSASRRCSLARLPWCAATCSAPIRSDSWRVTRSAIRRVLTKISVVRCASIRCARRCIDLLPHLGRHHGFERSVRNLEREIARAAVAGIDDGAVGAGAAVRSRSDQKTRDLLDRLLRGGEADALQPVAAQRRQALERDRQMGAALVGRQCVDLVDDHGPGGRQHGAAGFRAEQDVKRLRRGHHDMRRTTAHAVALAGGRVASTHPGADIDVGQAPRLQRGTDAGERRFQVAPDVVRQRLERRDVDNLGFVLEPMRERLAHQGVDGREEGRERLAGSGGRRDQHMPAGLERRPGLRLRRRRRGEAVVEPVGDGRMKQGHFVHWHRKE